MKSSITFGHSIESTMTHPTITYHEVREDPNLRFTQYHSAFSRLIVVKF